jgi:hypothetical protein
MTAAFKSRSVEQAFAVADDLEKAGYDNLSRHVRELGKRYAAKSPV